MNENANDTNPSVCLIELEDFDLPVSLDLSLLGRLRVDDDHASDAYVNPVISKLSPDSQIQGHCSEDLDSSSDVLNYIRTFLLDDDVDEKAETPVNINVVSCDLNFEPQLQSSRGFFLENLDFRDDELKYMRHFLLEDNVEQKTVFPGSIDDTNLASTKLRFDSPNMISEVHSCGVDSDEDLYFSDDVLKYINHILMDESIEEKTCSFQESEALQAAEKSLHEAMWGQYPSSTSHHVQNNDHICFGVMPDCVLSSSMEQLCPYDSSIHGFDNYQEGTNLSSQFFSLSPDTSSSGAGLEVDGTECSPVSGFELVDICSGRQTVLHEGNLVVCLSDNDELPNDRASREISDASTGTKHWNTEVPELVDARSTKQFAVHSESSLSEDLYDKVLVFRQEKEEFAIREEINEAIHHDRSLSRGSKSGRKGKKKREGKKNEVDLRTLLNLCAQAVAAEDRRSVNEFLRQIRQHSTPAGDGMQRVAHYFADGLEARMAGAGTHIYTTLMNMPISSADLLKGYHLYLATCPHRKTSNFFSNQNILNVAENCTTLHIVDFGTLYGFQWPSFLHKLSLRQGGPPTVRFTAIDFPCPGFRPSQRIAETGRRLTSYAKKFNVPFEFKGLAQKWETIKLEDIKMKKGEVLVVNYIFRLRYLLDETVISDCPRDIVLNLIRKMNPTAFVLGIMNGGYNGPFFLTRFREALFHYSSLFDALDAVIPRDRHERMLLERVVLGREAMNAIACEGAERIERPETYKQWQVRVARAGMEVMALNRKIVETSRSKVKMYHKDFVIDVDGEWLLQGWKGRISFALSCWKPAS